MKDKVSWIDWLYGSHEKDLHFPQKSVTYKYTQFKSDFNLIVLDMEVLSL